MISSRWLKEGGNGYLAYSTFSWACLGKVWPALTSSGLCCWPQCSQAGGQGKEPTTESADRCGADVNLERCELRNRYTILYQTCINHPCLRLALRNSQSNTSGSSRWNQSFFLKVLGFRKSSAMRYRTCNCKRLLTAISRDANPLCTFSRDT